MTRDGCKPGNGHLRDEPSNEFVYIYTVLVLVTVFLVVWVKYAPFFLNTFEFGPFASQSCQFLNSN